MGTSTVPIENPPVYVTRQLEPGTVIIKPFGYDFFDISSPGFQPISNLPPPAEYPLGPGDYVQVIMTSSAGQQTDVQLLVDALGRLQIPSVGLVKVSGATVSNAESIIARSVRSRFPNLNTHVILKSIRPIQVFVVGRVKKPGAYILPGLSTLLNALYSAGGPSINGSLRTISVARNKKTIASIDLYQLLLHGDRSNDITLQSGDSIFIPPVGQTTTIVGEVKQPAIYELLGTPTVRDIIQMAGGASGDAALNNVRVERILGSSKKVLVDLALASDNAPDWTFPVQNGDTVMVRSVLDDASNRVEIIGQVKRPGSYELSNNMTVSDLVRRAEGFTDAEIYLDRATIIRTKDTGEQELLSTNLGEAMSDNEVQDIHLLPKDRLIIYSKSDAASLNRTVQIEGEIGRPGVYERRDGMRLRDLIIAAGGPKPEAYSSVEIARSDPSASEPKTTIVNVNLAQAMAGHETDNILLSDGDQIAVRNRSNAQSTAEVIVLTGEVRYPGPYALLTRNERLSSVIARAGGLTTDAFPEGVIFTRDTPMVLTEGQLQVAQDVQQGLRDLSSEVRRLELAKYGIKEAPATAEPSTIAKATGFQTSPNPKSATAKEESAPDADQSRTVEDVSLTTRVTIDLPEALANPEGANNIPLQAGDRILVPRRPLVVSVAGAVVNPSARLYQADLSLDDYIARAGGPARDADLKNTVVVRASGDLYRKRQAGNIKLGDIIIVPSKTLTAPKSRIDVIGEIARVISNVAITAAVIAR